MLAALILRKIMYIVPLSLNKYIWVINNRKTSIKLLCKVLDTTNPPNSFSLWNSTGLMEFLIGCFNDGDTEHCLTH